jgi:glycosyltransferase involved in cell wall biosynthesis
MASMSSSIAILMSTFNGARFLDDQLASFVRQSHKKWLLVATDDGSTDQTVAVLSEFRRSRGAENVVIRTGPARGFVANFLAAASNPDLKADFYAFSDQDDIWEADKLSRALEWLHTVPSPVPAAYGSRTRLIDWSGNDIGLSPLFRKPPAFANALVQNIAGGNTMVFNEAARSLLIAAGGVVDVPSHDWWLYLLVTACGGAFYYDRYCSVRYRRHADNLVGTNSGMTARMHRARMLIRGRFQRWTDMNLRALESVRAHMTEESHATFDAFREARRRDMIGRLIAVRRSGVYRQTFVGEVGLLIGVALNKI